MTGWERHLDVGDTLLRRQVHNLAERYRFSAERAGAPLVEDDDFVGVVLSHDSVWGNDVVLLRPVQESGAESLVERLTSRLPGSGNLWSAWPTPDLSGYGMVPFGHPPAMVRAPTPGASLPAPPGRGVRVVEADADALMADYDRTVIHGFPLHRSDGSPVGTILRSAFLDGPWRFFVAYADDEPVSVASVFVACGVAQVEWVATLPDHRGRGLGEAVTWAATLAEPEAPAVLLASDAGRPIYERMGFLAVTRFTLWHWPGRKAAT